MNEFKKVIAGVFYYVFKYRKTLAKALAWPFSVFILLDCIEYLEFGILATTFIGIAKIAIQTVFAITTHRVVLLGPESVPKWGLTSWSKRETFFAFHIVGLYLIIIFLSFLGAIPVLGAILALVVLCWLIGRLSLVFPGIAVDKGVSFNLSWELTKNYQLLMFLVVIVFPLLLTIPIVLVTLVPHAFLLSSLLSTFVLVFEVAALSMAYLLITSETFGNG